MSEPLQHPAISVATPAHFAKLASGGKWVPARHLLLLNRYLMDLSARAITHLLVSMPPRHGKSTMISKYFPAWYLGTHQTENVIIATYGSEFASSWGQEAKKVLESHWDKFGPGAKPWKVARRGFDLSIAGGGNLLTAGVGSSVTGYGGSLILADDLIKNSEEADSPVYREKTDNWFRSTLYSRMEPRGVIVIISTRWHIDDLVGRLIKEGDEGGIKWAILNMPAVSEEDEPAYPYGMGRKRGDALWPERYDASALKQIEIAQGPRHWSSLYQGNPIPAKGRLFERDWFEIMPSAPVMMRAVRYWDFAATEQVGSRDPDYTAGVLMGIDAQNRYWVLDVCRFRGDPGEVESRLRAVTWADRHNPIVRVLSPIVTWLEQEPGSGSKIAIKHIVANVLPGFPVFAQQAGSMDGAAGMHNKARRADPLAGQAKVKNVKILAGQWNKDFLFELCLFPSGSHDDMVDACSGALNKLIMARVPAQGMAGPRSAAVTQWQPPEMSQQQQERQPWEM